MWNDKHVSKDFDAGSTNHMLELLPIEDLLSVFHYEMSTKYDVEKKKLEKIRKAYDFDVEEMGL